MCEWEESRRSPLREFLLFWPPRPPSKLLSCCPKAVSEGRWGDGLEEPASLGPRSFLLRFGGIIKGGIEKVGSFIEVRRAAGVAVSEQSMKALMDSKVLSRQVRCQSRWRWK